MKKLLLTGLLSSIVLVGCSDTKDEAIVTPVDASNTELSEQLKAYETTIHDQQEKIKQLEQQITELQNKPISMEDYIIVFRGDETASYVLPTLIPHTEDEDLVLTIHGFVSDGYDIGLNDYRFEDDGQLLVLDYDENAQRVQGSAGTYIFLESMQQSYFANFPELKGIKLLLNGDSEIEVIGESGSNAIFVRPPFVYEPTIEF